MPEPAASASAEPEVVRPSLSPETAADALAFLDRAMIQAREIPIFLAVRVALEAIASRKAP